jgi:hypothetical protein
MEGIGFGDFFRFYPPLGLPIGHRRILLILVGVPPYISGHCSVNRDQNLSIEYGIRKIPQFRRFNVFVGKNS